MKVRRFLLLLCALLTVLCAKNGAIEDVQSAVHQRIGERIASRQEASANEEVATAVRALLRQPLTADRAVQIALLNNRELLATLEDVGVASADLTEAGLLKNPVLDVSARFPDRAPSGSNLEFGLVQDILDLLMIPLRKKVAANELNRAKLRVGDEVLKLAGEVKTAFYTLQGKQQLLGRLDERPRRCS